MSPLDRLVRLSLGRSEEAAEDLLSALNQAGGSGHLAEKAEKNPDTFLAVLGWA
jgi:hypothetical protein